MGNSQSEELYKELKKLRIRNENLKNELEDIKDDLAASDAQLSKAKSEVRDLKQNLKLQQKDHLEMMTNQHSLVKQLNMQISML